MNEDEVREKLAAAYATAVGCRPGCSDCATALDALLPVVREIAAEELREAAGKIRALADGPVPAIDSAFDTVVILRASADALTKPPDGPVR